jgi:hypothetical protein
VVIDTSDHLGFPQHPGHRIDQHHSADDVDLPQLHRRWPLPADIGVPPPFPFPLVHQAVPNQDPVHRGRRRDHDPLGRLAQQFHPDPFRPPPWMLPAHLRDQHGH